MADKPTNPPTLTPEELATLQATRANLLLNHLLIVVILAYGAYDCWKAYTPLGPWIYGIFAAIVFLMRPALPDELRKKIKGK